MHLAELVAAGIAATADAHATSAQPGEETESGGCDAL
jgi:hypothetical protein